MPRQIDGAPVGPRSASPAPRSRDAARRRPPALPGRYRPPRVWAAACLCETRIPLPRLSYCCRRGTHARRLRATAPKADSLPSARPHGCVAARPRWWPLSSSRRYSGRIASPAPPGSHSPRRGCPAGNAPATRRGGWIAASVATEWRRRRRCLLTHVICSLARGIRLRRIAPPPGPASQRSLAHATVICLRDDDAKKPP